MQCNPLCANIELSTGSYHLQPNESSEKLFIFFSGTTKKNGMFDFWKVGNAQDANLLFVSDGERHWYQNGVEGLGKNLDETIEKIREIASELKVKKIFTIGLSMGGYGAALFAARLNCNCLAFGLDTRLKVEGSRSSKRMPKRTKVVVPDLNPEISNSNGFFVFYAGEFDTLDLVGANYSQHLSNVQVRYLRGVGHGVARYLNKELGLSGLIKRFGNHSPLPKSKVEGELCFSPDVVNHIWAAEKALNKGKFDSAQKHAEAAAILQPKSEVPLYILGLIAIKKKNWILATKCLSTVTRLVPHHITAHLKLAGSLRELGDIQNAIIAYENLLKIKPESDSGSYWLGRLLWETGKKDEGFTLIKKAVELNPEKESHQSYLNKVTKELSNTSLVEENYELLYDTSLLNDGAASSKGILWVKPWGGCNTKISSATHVLIESIDMSKKYKDRKTSVNCGVREIISVCFEQEKALLKFELGMNQKTSSPIFAKGAVSFRLLKKTTL